MKLFYIAIFHLIAVIRCAEETVTSGTNQDASFITEETVLVNNTFDADPRHRTLSGTSDDIGLAHCPDNVECLKLSADCLNCTVDYNCNYGDKRNATCKARSSVVCMGQQVFNKTYKCQYCYQTERWQQSCSNSTNCKVVTAPLEKYLANCSVNDDIICLGRRRFRRNLPCNWTSGKRWSTALILSITLGGFGADRFYLGHWRAGIGKLFSFGGLGVWTIVDVILVASGYVGPADYSLYIF